LVGVVDVFQFVPGYTHYVYEAGREPLFFMLAAFVLTFAAARTYTRVGRARGWGSGSLRGIHLHHLVPGIIASLASGMTIIAFRPGAAPMLPLAALFGCGAALTLDEFALILHLEDVYWTNEGRSSIEATLMGFAFGLLCLLAAAPLNSDPGKDVPHWLVAGIIGVNVLFALVAFLKGKAKLGAFGLLVPGLAILGALRLASPGSLWAHRFYSDQKLTRCGARAELQRQRYTHFKHRAYDVVGGKPHLERQGLPGSAGDNSHPNGNAK
jgi:hypothetical protein